MKKTWNPYIFRHSALTAKAKFLKENALRQHVGWTQNSEMPRTYIHFLGNESNEILLAEYGISTETNKDIVLLPDNLRPTLCHNCNESNIPDKFCHKCRMVLTYDAYHETLEGQKQKDDKIDSLENTVNAMQSTLEKLIAGLSKTTDQQFNTIAQSLFSSAVLKTASSTD